MKPKKMESLLGRHLEIRDRIFRMILFVGGFANFIALIETLVVVGYDLFVVPLAVLLATIIIALFISVKYNNTEEAAVIVGLVLCLLVFPTTFFINGGIYGGATVWLAINIIYAFLMFSGKRLVFFSILDCIVDISLYIVAYNFPETVTPLDGRNSIFADSLFSVLIVGFAVGAMIRFQIYAYEQERKIVKAQREALEESAKSKDRFFASMSHELRTPINSIVGLNEMILRQDVSQNIKAYAEDVKNAGKMLLSLVNDIIDLSQMELKKMEIVEAEYNPIDIVKDIIGITSIRLQQKKLEFFLNVDDKIPKGLIGDKKRIEQILLNLLINAIKYTEEGSVSLDIRYEYIDEDDITLVMSVVDTGTGIKKEDLENLYDAFKRMDINKHENEQGSGLGLTITKNLVDLMGGEITVDSIYTKGSNFTVKINQRVTNNTPIGRQEIYLEQIGEDTDEYTTVYHAPEARILVVDDNTMNLKVTEALLSGTQVKIDTATSGAECLEKTCKHFYHIIMLDHLMPGMDGVETLHKIRRQENGLCRDSAIIALTANAGAGAESYYINEGFNAYLEKPLTGKVLEDYVMAYLPEDIIEYNNAEGERKNSTVKKLIGRKKKRVIITTDCVSDLPPDLLEKYDIEMMYLYIKTENGRYADTKEIDSDSLSRFITEKESRAVADSVSFEEYEEFFANQLDNAEYVIHISMASNAGKSYGIALSAAKRFDHVKVIDSRQLSCGQAVVVLEAAKMAKNGETPEEIVKNVEKLRNIVNAGFLSPSVSLFRKNVHGSAVARLYEKMGLKPILTTRRSQISVKGFCIGNINTARRHFIQRRLRAKKKISPEIIYITHVGLNVNELELIKSEILRTIPFKEVYIQKGSFSCACNVGMGTFGFAYYMKKDTNE